MGTKQNPGKYDCYKAAEPDEPMFVLLARDPVASALVRMWTIAREVLGSDADQLAEAEECARAMDTWIRARRRRVPHHDPMKLIPHDMLRAELERRGATVLPAQPTPTLLYAPPSRYGSHEAAPIIAKPEEC